MAQSQTVSQYKKPLIYIGSAIGIIAAWFAIGLTLMASGVIMSVPAQDVQLMPADVYTQYQKDVASSDMWTMVWLAGLGIVGIVALVLTIKGIRAFLKVRK